MKKLLSVVLLITLSLTKAFTQNIQVYPLNWWIGMKHSQVQLLVHASDVKFNASTPAINYPGVTLDKVHRLENGKYFALDVSIAADAKPGRTAGDCLERVGAGRD